MAIDNTKEHLKELETALFKLQALSLGPEVETIVQEAIDQVKQLSKTSEGDLAAENTLLSQMAREKSRFVSVITHELRIPMTSIKGYADLLRQGVVGSLNEQQLGFIDVISSNVERMSALVSDLSDIYRLEDRRLKLAPTALSLPRCVDEALLHLRPKINAKNQVLEIDIPADISPAFADQSRVVQALTNLISNAWKFTPPGGKIRIHAQEQEPKLLIEVNDTGIGISQQDQAHLFDQFFRSEDPAVREQLGWGLGLSLTKQLIEQMGGEIGWQSSLGSGSTFWITLPRHAA
jgi:signal transduction histidine kinase